MPKKWVVFWIACDIPVEDEEYVDPWEAYMEGGLSPGLGIEFVVSESQWEAEQEVLAYVQEKHEDLSLEAVYVMSWEDFLFDATCRLDSAMAEHLQQQAEARRAGP